LHQDYSFQQYLPYNHKLALHNKVLLDHQIELNNHNHHIQTKQSNDESQKSLAAAASTSIQ
jgi:hypothetical protein